MSLMASFQSSVTILGYPAEMYLRGTQFWIVIISSSMAAFSAAELYLPVYYDLNLSSVNQYLKLRFKSEKVRLAGTASFLFATVPYLVSIFVNNKYCEQIIICIFNLIRVLYYMALR